MGRGLAYSIRCGLRESGAPCAGVSHGLWAPSAAAWLDSFTQLCATAMHRLLWPSKAVCPPAASPGHAVRKTHLSSEGLGWGSQKGSGVMWAVQLSRCMLSTAVHVGVSDHHLSCCSWMSRRMSWQRQHRAKHATPSGSLRLACGTTLRHSTALARQ